MVSFLEVFANDAIATVTSGGTDAPVSGQIETWTVSVARAFPTAQTTFVPNTAFYICDQASAYETEKILVTAGSGALGSQTWTVVRGADGTTPVAHIAGFTIVQVETRDSFGGLESLWTPAHHGLLDANAAIDIVSSTQALTQGVLFVFKVVPRRSYLASNVWWAQPSNPVGASTGTFTGLYSAAWTLLTGSADCASILLNNTVAEVPLTTPQQITAGVPYYAALLSNFATTQAILRVFASDSTASPNFNLSNANSRGAAIGTGLTALPTSIVMANLSQAPVAWVGIS